MPFSLLDISISVRYGNIAENGKFWDEFSLIFFNHHSKKALGGVFEPLFVVNTM